MKVHERLTGTKVERAKMVEVALEMLKEESFPDLNQQEFNKLFVEAFFRNVVQAELASMMLYIKDEEAPPATTT